MWGQTNVLVDKTAKTRLKTLDWAWTYIIIDGEKTTRNNVKKTSTSHLWNSVGKNIGSQNGQTMT